MNALDRPTPSLFPAKLALLWLAASLLASCARQGAPTGGPLDTTPPQMDTAASTPNFSTRFERRRIELKFDEWVTLSDVASQVVVSPPLAKRPEVTLKGKTVVFAFDKEEALRPNTTYTINFGSAVKDFREGNPARDLRFVFSTGDAIDSLRLKGSVADALTGQAVENASVMLYDNLADSALRKERPYYFTKTDKNGQFEFKNLRAGTFRIVAAEDADQNLRWDGENERIAFRDSLLRLGDSAAVADVPLRLFKNKPAFKLTGVQAGRYGLVKLGFNTPLDTAFRCEALAPTALRAMPEKSPDSLLFWYDLPAADTAWALVFSTSEGEGAADTVAVKKIPRKDFVQNKRILFADVALPAPSGKQKAAAAPGTGEKKPSPVAPKTVVQVFSKPAVLPFNLPIAAFDTSRFELLLDSLPQRAFDVSANPSSPRQLLFGFAWKQGSSHTLRLLPGAVTDLWGQANADTLVRIFNVPPEKQLGTLTVKVEKLSRGTPYVLQLLNGNSSAVEEERVFTAKGAQEKFTFAHLPVAAYSGRLIEDKNGNGRWDTGQVASRRQPERIFSKTFDALRPNWEVEAVFPAEEAEAGAPDKKGKK